MVPQALLNDVLTIVNNHRKLIRQSGEHFNIFNILGLTTSEVRLHSTFLAELLNPSGSHGMENFFLESFITYLKLEGNDIFLKLDDFKTAHAIVDVEYNIGPGNEELTTGGRVDILIRDANNQFIIIENKINARDQKNQLVRYDSIKNKAALIYLTPFGHVPSIYSAGNLTVNKDFICLSYKKNIVEWLRQSLEENTRIPDTVKYTIQQYIWLVNQFTSQSSSNIMSEEIIEQLISTDQNIESAFHIASHLEKLKNKRAMSILSAFNVALSKYDFTYKISESYHTFPRIELYPSGWNNHLIAFTNESGMLFGIKRVTNTDHTIAFNELKDIPDNFANADWWLCYSYLKGEEFNLNSHFPWIIRNEVHIAEKMAEQVNLLIEIAKRANFLLW